MSDPAQLRISDADRHKVADLLRDAAGEGRLEPDELDERLEAAYGAKVYGDLVPIVADIPGDAPRPGVAMEKSTLGQLPVDFSKGPTSAAPMSSPDTSFAVLSGVTRKGMWEVGERHTALAVMGGVEIDLRQARFAAKEVVIYANCVMGGVDITVNAWTHVIVEGVGIMGGFDQPSDRVEAQLDANSPTVRIKGVALMGGVSVTRRQMPGEKKRRKRLK